MSKMAKGQFHWTTIAEPTEDGEGAASVPTQLYTQDVTGKRIGSTIKHDHDHQHPQGI